MNLLRYIPLHLLLFLILGMVVGFTITLEIECTIISLIVLISVLYLFHWGTRKNPIQQGLFYVISLLIFFGVGLVNVSLNNSFTANKHYVKYIKAENKVDIRLIEAKKTNSVFRNYIGRIEQLNGVKVKGKIKVNIPLDFPISMELGDLITAKVNFKPIKPPLNPYQFNYQKYLLRQQIKHQIYLNETLDHQIKSGDKKLDWAAQLRLNINIQLKAAGFKGDVLNIMNALLLGQRTEITKELLDNYQKAGAIHLLAISGLHVGIILLMLNFLLSPLLKIKNGKIIRLCMVIGLLWSFALLAGLSASVVRATAMFTAVAIGLMSDKKVSTYKALVISMFFLLLINPYYLLNVGFQLSYLAVFFIVWVQPIIVKIWSPRYRIFSYPWQLFTVSLAAQIGVLPLSLYYFHQFPGLFFLSNLVIIPFLGLILSFGFLIIGLSFINLIPPFLQESYVYIIKSLNQFITWIGNQESFLFDQIPFTLSSVIFLYITILSLFYWLSKPAFKRLFMFTFSVFIFQMAFIYQHYSGQNDQWIVFNKSKHTLIGINVQDKLCVYSTMDETELEKSKEIKDYSMGSKTFISQILPLKNALKLKNTPLLIIDKFKAIPSQKTKGLVVLLRGSTQINLARFIQENRPLLVIADASNYNRLISHWEKTCSFYNIKFHYTVRDGAFLGQL